MISETKTNATLIRRQLLPQAWHGAGGSPVTDRLECSIDKHQ